MGQFDREAEAIATDPQDPEGTGDNLPQTDGEIAKALGDVDDFIQGKLKESPGYFNDPKNFMDLKRMYKEQVGVDVEALTWKDFNEELGEREYIHSDPGAPMPSYKDRDENWEEMWQGEKEQRTMKALERLDQETSKPVQDRTTVYRGKDKEGTTHFTNDPERAKKFTNYLDSLDKGKDK